MIRSDFPIAELYVLAALNDRPLHGYIIYRKVERLTQGRVILSLTTIYRVLKRLKCYQFVNFVEPTPPNLRGKKYKITELGKQFYQQTMNDLTQIGSNI